MINDFVQFCAHGMIYPVTSLIPRKTTLHLNTLLLSWSDSEIATYGALSRLVLCWLLGMENAMVDTAESSLKSSGEEEITQKWPPLNLFDM